MTPRGSEQSRFSPGNSDISDLGGAKSGALVDALAMLERLPLSDAERAEAIRRLIASE